ncbi:MAG: hypothetical protein ACREI9_09325 [Nitrospiraceae bacterium]
MSILTRRAVLAAKIEAVEGTAETLAAGDANFLVTDPKWEPDIPMFQRQNVDGSLSSFVAVPGTQRAVISFKVELKGSGAAGTAPALGKLLKACGFGETVVGGASVTYAPISISIPSLTMALYMGPDGAGNGKRYQIRGARGTCKYVGKDGDPGVFEFTFSGVHDGATDQALLTGTGLETVLPPALLTAAFTIAAFAAKVQGLSFDVGNRVAMRSDINKAEGFFSALITGRDMKGSVDPEEELATAHDFWTRWKAGTTGVLTWKHGATAGNICTFSAPVCQYVKGAIGDRDGIATVGLDFMLARSAAAGNDEISIAFT